jgi:hypothetical protein
MLTHVPGRYNIFLVHQLRLCRIKLLLHVAALFLLNFQVSLQL